MREDAIRDLVWAGVATAFYLFSAWFVGVSNWRMPAARRTRPLQEEGDLEDGDREAEAGENPSEEP